MQQGTKIPKKQNWYLTTSSVASWNTATIPTLLGQRWSDVRFCLLIYTHLSREQRATPCSSDFTLFIPRSTHPLAQALVSGEMSVVFSDDFVWIAASDTTRAQSTPYCLTMRMVPYRVHSIHSLDRLDVGEESRTEHDNYLFLQTPTLQANRGEGQAIVTVMHASGPGY
jgi:hypothetical protein